MIDNMINAWKRIVNDFNEKGIPLPLARDPKHKTGSVSLTLVVMSSSLVCMSVLFMLGAAISKASGFFIVSDAAASSIQSAFNAALQFFLSSIPLYWARNYKRDEKGAISIEQNNKPLEKE